MAAKQVVLENPEMFILYYTDGSVKAAGPGRGSASMKTG